MLAHQQLQHLLLLLPPLLLCLAHRAAGAPSPSPECEQRLKDIAELSQPWVFEMLDSSAQSARLSGSLRGHIVDFGYYDECIDIAAAMHCLARGGAEGAMLLGVCVPHSCPANVALAIYPGLNLSSVDAASCRTASTSDFHPDAGDVAACVVFSAILVAVVASSLYDWLSAAPRPALAAFSLLANGRRLLRTNSRPDPGFLACLDGMRVLTMVWVVAAHKVGSYTDIVANGMDLLRWAEYSPNWYFVNGSLSVDTFFVLGGLVVGYAFVRSRLAFNPLKYYLHRYLRLTPALAAVWLLYSTLFVYIGDGPWWRQFVWHKRDYCRDYWWSTLLYVQNYHNHDKLCVGQTWYLSVDFQLFLLSPLLLYPLRRWPRVGLGLLGLAIVGGFVAPFAIAYRYHLDANNLAGLTTPNPDHGKHYYMATEARFGPYVIGLAYGYLIHQLKQHPDWLARLPAKRWINAAAWPIAVATMCACVWGGAATMPAGNNQFESAIYLAMHRNAWAIAVGVLAVACVTGYGGPFDRALSHPVFQVLSRLTYSLYLVHMIIMHTHMGQQRYQQYFTAYDAMHGFWGDYVLATFTAALLYLTFEAPMATFEKLLLGSGGSGSKPTIQTIQNK